MGDTHHRQTDDQIARLLSVATVAAANYRSGPYREVEQLAAMAEDRCRRRDLVRVLLATLRASLLRAWQFGWQPADLHRFASRKLRAPEQSLIIDAMADELSTYAAATLDPRWPAQLRELGITAWWPSDQTYLEARAEAGAPWTGVVTTALRALHLVNVLPRLEPIGPLPGTARPVTGRGADGRQTEGQAEVGERILSRVRALLAKAESTTFEAEAETFTAGAQALMARHSIDAALLAASAPESNGQGAGADGPGARRIGIDNPYESPKSMLLSAVAHANRCRAVWSRDLGFVTVVGHAADLDAVETLFTSLLVQATAAMTREGSRRDTTGRSRTRAFRLSFLSSYAARIGERLREVTRLETEFAAQEPSRSGGRELVPLLAAREAQVDAALDRLFPRLQTRSVNLGSDVEGWQSGRTAADRASIGRGGPIEGPRASR